jgi:hypothetical protein
MLLRAGYRPATVMVTSSHRGDLSPVRQCRVSDGLMSRVHGYCRFADHRGHAFDLASHTKAERREYHDRCAEFSRPTFDALYRQCIQPSSISSTAVDALVHCRTCFVYTRCVVNTIRNAQESVVRLPGEGDMRPAGRCHPFTSPPPAPCGCRTRANRPNSSARPTGAE